MTRRERHIRILDNFGRRATDWEMRGVIAKFGLGAFTDEAIEWMARQCVRGYRMDQKRNAENRAMRAAE